MFSVVLTVFEMVWESRFQCFFLFFFFFQKQSSVYAFLKVMATVILYYWSFLFLQPHSKHAHEHPHTLFLKPVSRKNCQRYENQHLIFSSAQVNLNLYSPTSQCKHWNPIEMQLPMNSACFLLQNIWCLYNFGELFWFFSPQFLISVF